MRLALFPLADEKVCAQARQIFLLLLAFVLALGFRPYLWADVPAVFWAPISFFQVFSSPPFGKVTLWAATIVLPLFCLASALRPRWWVSGLTLGLGWAFLPYGMNFGKIDHYYNMVALTLLADFVVQCGIRLRPAQRVFWLNWLCQFVQLALVLLYFFSGITKLAVSGTSWFLSDNMEIMLREHQAPWGVWLAGLEPLPNLLATGAVALELLSPLALFSPWLALFFLASWGLMHASIFLFMGPNFLTHSLVFVFFLPLLAGLRGSLQGQCSLRPFFAGSLALYLLLSVHQAAFKLDSWPLSSFPMYSSDYSKAGVKRYDLIDAGGREISLLSFPPFLLATLGRSLRKSAEKGRHEELREKMEYLERRHGGPLRLRLSTWEKTEDFDLTKPEKIEWIYPPN